jgi:hypothetical protein
MYKDHKKIETGEGCRYEKKINIREYTLIYIKRHILGHSPSFWKIITFTSGIFFTIHNMHYKH